MIDEASCYLCMCPMVCSVGANSAWGAPENGVACDLGGSASTGIFCEDVGSCDGDFAVVAPILVLAVAHSDVL